MKRRTTDSPFSSLKALLPKFLSNLEVAYDNDSEVIMQAWPEIIGDKMAPMTKVHSFQNGVLTVHVVYPALLGLLRGSEKEKLLRVLRKRFPRHHIKNIEFYIGS